MADPDTDLFDALHLACSQHSSPLIAFILDHGKSDVAIKRFDHYRGEAFYLVPIMDRTGVKGVISVTEKVGSDSFDKKEQEILLNIVL